MAVEKVIDIVVNTNQAVKEINTLFDTMVDQQTEANKQQDKLNDSVEDLGKTAKSSEKGLKAISKGFKGVGLAIKAAGIGLVIGLLSTLKDLFMSNERVANAMATAMETVSVVFNEVTNAIFDTIDAVSKSTSGFQALSKVLSGVVSLGLNAVKFNLLNISLALEKTQLAWEKSIFGGQDADKIEELNKGIQETRDSLIGVIKGAVDAGKNIVNNFGDAIDEVGTLASAVTNSLSEIDLKAAAARAKANIQLIKSAKIAEAQSKILLEQYDRQAEKLRQIRDNEFKSIDERKKANDELGVLLDKQEKAMIKQANAVLASARAQYAKTKSTDDLVGVLNAQAEVEGVVAHITGLRSEQDANANALKKEGLELESSKVESINAVKIAEANATAELETNEIKKINAKRKAFELEKQIEIERLENNKNKYAEGTQAFVDAENELRARKQEFAQTDKELKAEKDAAENEIQKENAKKKIETAQMVADAEASIRDANISNISSGISLIAGLDKKNKVLQGAALIADNIVGTTKTVINTQAANSAAIAKYALIPGGQALSAAEITANNISAGISIASSTLATAKGLSALGGGSAKGASVSGGGASAPSAPAFNLVGGTGTNQIKDTVEGGDTPIRAVVVSSDVSTAQELDRNIIDGATLG